MVQHQYQKAADQYSAGVSIPAQHTVSRHLIGLPIVLGLLLLVTGVAGTYISSTSADQYEKLATYFSQDQVVDAETRKDISNYLIREQGFFRNAELGLILLVVLGGALGLGWSLFMIRKVNTLYQKREADQATLSASSKMAGLGIMAAGIAHEINNPLGIIAGYCMVLRKLVEKKKMDGKKITETANDIQEMVTRAENIIRGLSGFSRGSDDDPFEKVSAHEIVHSTLSICRDRIKDKGISLKVALIPEDIFINARTSQLQQVLLNLLNNSVDAVGDLDEKWIRVGVRFYEDWAQISVTDSGKGIPAEIREKIFQPFFTTKEVGQGTGLGLSVSGQIIKSHKGQLELDENYANTRFIIRLPRSGPTA